MDQASRTSQGDAFQFLWGECVGRGVAAEKATASQPWGKLACAVFVLSVPLTYLRHPPTLPSTASQNPHCAQRSECVFIQRQKKKSHIGNVSAHSFPHCNLCGLSEEIQRNWTPLCRVELLRRAPQAKISKRVPLPVWIAKETSLQRRASLLGARSGISVHLHASS